MVPGTAQRARARDQPSCACPPGADPGRRLRQRAQHGRARSPRHGHGSRAVRARAFASRASAAAGEVVEGSVLEMPFADGQLRPGRQSLDVIEHLEDDLAALRELRRVVAPGGALLVTVPAYQWLWSGHDEINHHHRRYTRRSLQRGRRAGRLAARCARPTSTRCCCRSRSLLRVLDRCNRKKRPSRASTCGCRPNRSTGCSSARSRSRRALIGRGGRIPAGLSLLASFARGEPAEVSACRRPPSASACMRKVQARLARNVAHGHHDRVAQACAMSSSRPASSTNR